MVINPEVAKAMRDLGFLTEVAEDDSSAQFRARAYYRAADTIGNLPEDISDIYGKAGVKGLLEIPSIGKNIAAKIEEYVKTGRVRALEDLKAKIPIEIDELYGIEGVGPKTVRALYDKLKVKNLADLEKAANEGRLRTVPGFSEKKEQDILKKIGFFKKGMGRRIIGEVYPLVKQIEKSLSQVAGVKNAMAAGSVRRMKETIGDIDYIVAASDPEPVMDFFTKMPEVQEVIGRGPAKAFVRLAGGIDADLLVVPEESWGSALQYFTGSKEHSVELRKIAIARGLRLNEWGVFKGEKRVAGATEEDVYKMLGLQWVPPEMRENAGEIELARQNRIPELVEYGSLKGDLQVHSENSDGTATIEEMARAAKEFGLDYVAITDHTKSLALAGGLDNDTLGGGNGNDLILGGDGNDVLNGDGNSDRLDGGAGNDTLNGGSRTDTLIGGLGDDRLDGGVGNDIVDYSAAAAGVTVNLALGTATGEGNDTLVSIERVIGSSFADTITGNDVANLLTGGAGNDTLRGGGANDTLVGGTGIDQLFGDAGHDILLWDRDNPGFYDGGAGFDTLDAKLSTADNIDLRGANFAGLERIQTGGGKDVVTLSLSDVLSDTADHQFIADLGSSSPDTLNIDLGGGWTATQADATLGPTAVAAGISVSGMTAYTFTNGDDTVTVFTNAEIVNSQILSS